MTWHVWLAFLGASVVISLSPGAGAIASMSTGLRHGLRRGYWNIFGLQIGLLLQIAIVAVGLGAVLANSALAFTVIKWFGVAYLVYLGIRQWRAAPTEIDGATPVADRGVTMLVRGFLVNASNPKAVVFMLAVLPQFLDPSSPLLPQYLVIAATMVAVDMLVMTGYTSLASRVLRVMRSRRQQVGVNRTFAGLFFVAASFLATIRRAAPAA
ncbi:homoserine/homoserine lactone efflux protein [Rhodococcus sp. BP-252]|uniref:Threonine transporter RhtB n=1 Tax=Rhodococcoides kyotonense TaxID=398843 RepID=A0A177YQ91_9NOCA|nr:MULTISPECIES: homoserine/homoserine lactone efflux protein [Rhodococcus]MBY6411303.1 homoserine/homoserine lactone efflux protein [Rhodococcus sp. BP-320]MBY6415962.1 homoserine/homoserine lactone efflux protein [Rhodococcus sp. BP-321]MBY6420529.1 homoserine/homoserine lactone efflux protein [Rhodococcus sp. BP-324]MBY6426169.1 homoserine/homoserine lactone efflux protein [Rhodococcus sp. BP-323]MBY6431290.1 homoserine/homoserine lactone efflux protein [Rhodococcus sp. BP-322]